MAEYSFWAVVSRLSALATTGVVESLPRCGAERIGLMAA
jgi:hypothetical protein